jgi:hypothetical protein
MSASLADLDHRPWVCSGCGVTHTGLFDLVFARPYYWPADEPAVTNGEIAGRRHFLADDFCILNGEHRFVRCVLALPIVGGGEAALRFGVWSSLSEASFLAYAETFNESEGGGAGPWFGWLSNRLPFYPDTLNLGCRVHPQDGRRRPEIELEPTDHPLAVDQRSGISVARVLELYAAAGHAPSD